MSDGAESSTICCVTYSIRAASVDDADALGVVSVRAWQAAYRKVMPDEYLDNLEAIDRAEYWRRHLTAAPSDRHVRVIVIDGDVVGFAAFGPAGVGGDDVGELNAINLDPAVWGRGLGRALLSQVTSELGALGYLEAMLWVVPQNDRARALYESGGWIADGTDRHQEVFGVTVPEMRYRRSLDE